MHQLASLGELWSQRPGFMLGLIVAIVLMWIACARIQKNTRRNARRQASARDRNRPKMPRRSRTITFLIGAFATAIGILGIYGGGVLVAQLATDFKVDNESQEVAQQGAGVGTRVDYFPTSSFYARFERASYPNETARLVATGDVVERQFIPQALPTRDLSSVQTGEDNKISVGTEPKAFQKVESEETKTGGFFTIGSVLHDLFVSDRAAFSLEKAGQTPNAVATDLRARASTPRIIQVSAEEATFSSSEEEASFDASDLNAKRRAACEKALRSFVIFYGRNGQQVIGCGFLVQYNQKPYIITNQHVVSAIESNADFEIVLPDSAVIHPVSRIVCPELDVAILVLDKNEPLEEHSLYPCEIGDCGKLRLFDEIITIGAPSNLPYSPALGNVIHPCRDFEQLGGTGALQGTNRLAEFMQIDVTIHPGNSGGPVVNLDGQVVAMTSARMGNNNSINGLAIPINDVLRVARILIDNGRWVPTQIKGFSQDCFKTTPRAGYRSGYVEVCRAPGSNREVSGELLKVGDIITKYNGFDVTNHLRLLRLIALSDPTKKAKIEIVRNSQPLEIEVELTGAGSL